MNLAPRKDEILVDAAILKTLHAKCSGWRERMWEKLTDEHGIEIGYSTLTRKVRGARARSEAARRPGRGRTGWRDAARHLAAPDSGRRPT